MQGDRATAPRAKKKKPAAPAYQPPSAAGKDTKSDADRSRATDYKTQKAPAPSVKEQAAGRGRQRTRNAQRADNVRKARGQVPAVPLRQPGLPPEVKNPLGAWVRGDKPRPQTFLDTLNKKGTRFTADDSAARKQRQKRVDYHVANLMATGRSLHKQERTIDHLRNLGVVPGSSEFDRIIRRFRTKQAAADRAAAAARAPKKKDKGGGGIGGAISDVFHGVYGGGDSEKGKGGSAVAAARPGSLGGATLRSATGGGLYAIPKNVGLVLGEDPTKQIPKLAGDTAKSIASIPAGLVAATVHPVGTAKAIGEDYAHRYGDLARGDEEAFRRRLRKEGVAPEVTDIAAGVGGGGAIAGRGLQAAAKAGKLGRAAEKVATERPNLRVSGNVSQEQAIHPNFFRNAAAAGRDSARGKVQARRAGQETAPLEVRQAQAAGEVTHIRKGATKRAQHKAAAGGKGRRLATMKAEGQREDKAARKNVDSLSKTEQRALNYAMKFGIHDAETARRELPQWIERVKAERAKHEADTGKSIPAKQNEVPELEYLLQHADEAFTPNVARVAQEEGDRAARIGAADPGFDNTAGERRRHIAQAELTGEARPLSKAEAKGQVAAARETVKEAKAELGRQERMHQDSMAGAGVARGRAQILSRNVDGAAGERRAAAATAEGNQFAGGGHGMAQAAKGLRAATANVTKAKAAVKDAEDALARTEGIARDGGYVVKDNARARAREAKVAVTDAEAHLRRAHGDADVKAAEAALDEARATLKRASKAQGDGERVVTAKEFDADHLPRVVEAARQRGLGEAAYTVSEKRPAGVFSAFGVGGTKAIAGAKRYEGALLRTGRENTSPDAHVLSIQKGIKRKHNWNLVADTFEEHAAPDLRHQTLDELRDELDRRGIDPDSVAFWNPGRYKAEREHFDKMTDGGGEADIADPTFESRNVKDAMDDASLDDIDSIPSKFAGTNGWSVVPRAVYDEIHADIKPSGKVGRSYDIAKGKVSRVLLAQPAWLQFQVASNALMAGLAGVGPGDAIKAQRWWKTLSTAERDAIEPYIGVTAWFDDQRHLGAASNARMVNAYRAFKGTSFYRKAHKGNPLNLLFRADHAQNNFFRRAVLYNRLKREAYANMGRETRKITAAQQRIMDSILGRSPEDAMRALLKDGKTIERHAKAVNDFLGNWTTYTARERRLFSRSVMFYGFLRFSVKLAFYTMPLEHPLMSSILLQMGHLQNDELEKLFGGDAPVWEIGSYHDHGLKFNAARLNPFFNALQYQGPGSLIGSFGPLAQVTADQVAGKNVSFDRLFTVNGDTRYVSRAKDLSITDRLHIAAAEMEKVSPYLRMAERWKLKGRQTSDSWLLHPRGTGSPGLGEKSHDAADVLREGLAPIAGESDKAALDAAKALNGPVLSTEDILSGKAKLPPLPKLPALPKTITIQVR